MYKRLQQDGETQGDKPTDKPEPPVGGQPCDDGEPTEGGDQPSDEEGGDQGDGGNQGGDEGGEGGDQGGEGGDKPTDKPADKPSDKPTDKPTKGRGKSDFEGGRDPEPSDFIEGELADSDVESGGDIPNIAKPKFAKFTWR